MTPPPVDPATITWKTPGVRGYLALALVVLGLVVTINALIPTLDALGQSGEVAAAEAFDLDAQRAAFDADMRTWTSIVNGRSPFFIPPEPVFDEPEEVVADTDEEDDPVEVKPRRYEGPDIIAAMNGRIWLDNNETVRLGEEASGVRLVSLDDVPWTVRVAWRGVEFDVEIFRRNTDDFLVNSRDRP